MKQEGDGLLQVEIISARSVQLSAKWANLSVTFRLVTEDWALHRQSPAEKEKPDKEAKQGEVEEGGTFFATNGHYWNVAPVTM